MALFATTNLRFANDINIPEKGRIPAHLCAGDAGKQLLAEKLAVEMDESELTKPLDTPPAKPPVKNWDFKVEDIQSKSLEQLNMLIQENVKKKKLAPVKVFTDLEEAILFMTGS